MNDPTLHFYYYIDEKVNLENYQKAITVLSQEIKNQGLENIIS